MESLLLDLKQFIDNECFDEDKDFIYIDTRINEEYWKDNLDYTQRDMLKEILNDLSLTLEQAFFKMVDYILENRS